MRTCRSARAVLGMLAASGFAIAAAWSLRLAVADYWFQKTTAAATAKAIAITPDQAEYHVRVALLTGDDDPAGAIAALRRAVALNPHDGQAWIELGLHLESAGDLAAAGESLLRAAAVDRTYLPRWTLMNYYFRRADRDRFWTWAKAAANMIYGDPAPFFDLCDKVSMDGGLIDRLDLRDPRIQGRYVFHLFDVQRPDLAGPAARRVLQGHRAADVPLLLEACDRLIAARRVDDARAIWDGLGLPANGDVAAPSTGRGFDWRVAALEGISAAREENPPGLRLSFSGTEAEEAEPLLKYVPVNGNTGYRLVFTYRTADIDPGSGLHWQIADAGNGQGLTSSDDLSSSVPVERQTVFVTPPACRLIRLSLGYRRRAGTTRLRGSLVLRNVKLE